MNQLQLKENPQRLKLVNSNRLIKILRLSILKQVLFQEVREVFWQMIPEKSS